jgi:tetratricopeptide (TPR) repeat protein
VHPGGAAFINKSFSGVQGAVFQKSPLAAGGKGLKMIIHKDLTIQLKEPQIKQLKGHYRKVIRHLEEGFHLKLKVLEALKNDLSGIINHSPQWQEVLHSIHDGDDFYCIHLMHPDNEILNLPWSMAVDSKSNKQLGNIERLYLTKSIPGCFEEKGTDFPKAPAPLKVLVMISSPEDTEWIHRLSYEEEEYAILKAFEPLMQQGAVEVDFTEDGSLEALERKLKTNKYHILHFSGHAIFREKDKTGYLQLENPLNLNTQLAAAKDFASAVNCHTQHKVPMVMLSSCQTAQGYTEEGLRGVTNHLLRQGVPVVISMGMAVKDKYAALFSAYFYRKLAEKKTIFSAFNEAIDYLRNMEHNDLEKKPGSREVPLQWIIPNLYLSRKMEEVVDWEQPQEELKFSSQRYIFGQERLLLPHEKDYRFIGRRKDKAEILGPFYEKVPILLKGQGGVGKTAMAEHLVQRLIAKEPKTLPFLFDESTRSIKEILDTLQNFLIDQGHERVIANVNLYEKAMDKFQYLIFQVKETHQPIFVLDNLESFQKVPGEDFADESSDIKEVIAYLCERKICHVILTCRYPVSGFKNLQSFDLNQVGFNDFWKKCLYMDVGDIHKHLLERTSIEKACEGLIASPGLQYIEIVKLLHDTFGGNYRALELFDLLLKEKPDKIIASLDSLEKFRESSKETIGHVKYQMGQNLLFSQLMSLLSPDQQRILELLSHFRIPVQQFALQLQIQNQSVPQSIDFKPILESLNRLTLIEVTINQDIKTQFYYVTPIVKDLIENHPKIKNAFTFSHEQGGIYYYQRFRSIGNVERSLTPLQEAFYHFDRSGNIESLQKVGGILTAFYFEFGLYRNAFYYGSRIFQVAGDETDEPILNRLGRIKYLYGDYDSSLTFYKKVLNGCIKRVDKKTEGTILVNISQIYKAWGDYDTAIKFLQKGLKIQRRIKDKKGEGLTLNEFSQIYNIFGDYDKALKYLKQSLSISKEIGDSAGEGTRLSNIGMNYQHRRQYNMALKYLRQSLSINREIGNKQMEGITLNNIHRIYYIRGEYDIALKYIQLSLRISQEIGDKCTIAYNLHNIASIAHVKRDYEAFMKYETEAYAIAVEINDRHLIYNIGKHLGAMIYKSGYKEDGVKLLKNSYNIGKQSGYPDVGEIEAILKEIGEL